MGKLKIVIISGNRKITWMVITNIVYDCLESTYISNFGTLGKNGSCIEPCSWIIFLFDPVDYLEYGGFHTPHLVLGQDDKQGLVGIIGTIPYDGEAFLRISNSLKWPTLCKGNISNK